jgi:ketosteroid isomerase-like protein
MMRICLSALLLSLAVATASPCFAQSPRDFTNDSAFLKFLEQVAEARYQFNLGNVAPSLALWSPTDDVTLMGAGGGMEKGIGEVKPRIAFVTQQRTGGSGVAENQVRIEYLQVVVNGDFAYTVQLERRRLSVAGQTEPVDNVLRATDVFRKDNGTWKLVHRHADRLVAVTIPGFTPAPR